MCRSPWRAAYNFPPGRQAGLEAVTECQLAALREEVSYMQILSFGRDLRAFRRHNWLVMRREKPRILWISMWKSIVTAQLIALPKV